MTIAGILRDRISAPPPAADHMPNANSLADKERRSAEVRDVLNVLHLIVAAEHGELSPVAAVELGELLAVEASDPFDPSHDWYVPYVGEAATALRPIATGDHPELVARATEVLNRLNRIIAVDQFITG
jgi:hypothetical protein